MSLLSKRSLIARIRRSKDSRERLVTSNLDKSIAYQIRATRDRQKMTQSDLATKAAMAQNNISRLESPDYGKHTISSLKRIADALDVALVVKFVAFSEYINWLSGTPYLEKGLRPESLGVPSFKDEDEEGRFTEKFVGAPALNISPAIRYTLGSPKLPQMTGSLSLSFVDAFPSSPVITPKAEEWRKVG